MTNREFFLARRAAEYPTTFKVLEALPADQLDFRLHPRGRSARDLATHIIYGDVIGAELAVNHRIDYQEPPPAASHQELLVFADKANNDFRAELAKLSEEDWQRKATFRAGKKEFPVVLGEFLWFIHFGLIHHRGQLSTYLRPMGGKVPAIYGPSADEPGEL
jgi:uncharacterized damage-inducible protein DinB